MPAERRGLAIARRNGQQHAAGRAGEVVPLATHRELAVARQVRARELVAGTPPDGIAARIRSECGTTMIRAYRLALGIALGDVVAQVKAWYQAEGRKAPRFSETLLSAYENGQKRPGPEYLHYLCTVYRADPQDLGYQGRCLCGGRHGAVGRPSAPAAAETAAGRPPLGHEPGRAHAGGQPRGDGATTQGSAASDPGGDSGPGPDIGPGPGSEGDDDVLRRTMLRLLADAGAEVDSTFFGAVDRIRRRMDDALLAGRVSATMIDRWEEIAAGYARQYMTAPPLRLLCDALLDFGDIRRMCAERQPIESAERLCHLAGRLAGLAGMILINRGDPRLARSFFRTARTAVDETGDRGLRAWVAAREALVPLYYGDPGEALALASSAVDLAGRTLCVAGVMAPVVAARAAARMGGRGRRDALEQARGVLDWAHDVLDDLPACDRADTAFGYTERQLYFHEGDTLVALGDCQGASRAFTHALRGYSPDEFLDRTLIVLGQARCLLEAGEPEQALRLSQDALLGLPREHRPEIVLRAARLLGRSAAARHAGLPALREYREALLTG
jgi:tetratricopeptide (TPR) repeat protein